MQTNAARTATMPSALVLWDLLEQHGGNPPLAALEQAGFRRSDSESYLQRRASMSRCPGHSGS